MEYYRRALKKKKMLGEPLFCWGVVGRSRVGNECPWVNSGPKCCGGTAGWLVFGYDTIIILWQYMPITCIYVS